MFKEKRVREFIRSLNKASNYLILTSFDLIAVNGPIFMIYKLQHRWKFFIIEGRPIGSKAIVKGMTNYVKCFLMCFFTNWQTNCGALRLWSLWRYSWSGTLPSYLVIYLYSNLTWNRRINEKVSKTTQELSTVLRFAVTKTCC